MYDNATYGAEYIELLQSIQFHRFGPVIKTIEVH